MPIKRRIIKFGNSRVVALPAEWLEEYESRTGRVVEEVLLEVNGEIRIKVAENGSTSPAKQ